MLCDRSTSAAKKVKVLGTRSPEERVRVRAVLEEWQHRFGEHLNVSFAGVFIRVEQKLYTAVWSSVEKEWSNTVEEE